MSKPQTSSGPLSLRGREAAMVATLALVAFVAWQWSTLWATPPVLRLVVVVACGVVPALLSGYEGKRAAVLTVGVGMGSGLVLVATATHTNLLRLMAIRGSEWGALRARIDEGITNAGSIAIPVPNGAEAVAVSSVLLLLLGMIAFLITALGIVTRRSLVTVLTGGIALSYAWTLSPPDHPLALGVAAAALCLGVFAALARRGSAYALPSTLGVGALILVVAAVGSIGATSTPWWNWRSWSLGPQSANVTRLGLEQNYGPLSYPGAPQELLRVWTRSPRPLRAATLPRFDGSAFTTAGQQSTTVPSISGVNVFEVPRGTDAAPVEATVDLTRISARYVFSPGSPERIRGLSEYALRQYQDGSVSASPELRRTTRFTVVSEVPDPGPARLLAYVPTSAPDPVAIDRGVEVTPHVFGGAPLPTSEYGRLAPVAALARRLTEGSATQYEAVNRIERHLRESYRYDISVAAASRSTDELSQFLFETQAGYCQHFAGAMALMLRMSGIRARVAVGVNVNPRSRDAASGAYIVTDRDAHSWVEVDFGPQYGWLPFDPTPTRSASGNSASVSAASYRVDSTVAPTLAPEPVDPVTTPTDTTDPEPPESPAASDDPGASTVGWTLAWVGLGVVLLSVLIPVALKRVRALSRRRGTDRQQVLGAARELESWMVDLGAPPRATASAEERSDEAARRLGIDTATLYGLARAARFDRWDPPAGAGVAAWKELRRVKTSAGRGARARAAISPRSLVGHRRR